MSYDAGLGKRVKELERQQQGAAGFDLPGRWYELLVTPTCPPSRQLNIRGGTVTASPMWLWIMQRDFVPDMVCDFTVELETTLPLRFSNAGWYLPIILCLEGEWVAYGIPGASRADPPYFQPVVGDEVETSTQAEAQIDAWLNGYTQWYYYLVPLCGVVFKNNGVVDTDCSILAIDAVNRGRSYLYRDARMRHNLSG